MANNIKILGSNGTKGLEGGTSAFYIDSENMIDAGNLLKPLGVESARIKNIWLTHSHLDHIIDIAYVLDSYFEEREETLVIKGLKETLDAVKTHFFNDVIWPDFSKITLGNSNINALAYEEIDLYKEYTLGSGIKLEAFETDHTVKSCGYVVQKENSAVLITADTFGLESMISQLAVKKEIKSLVIECSFPSKMEELAKISKHLTPKLLFNKLQTVDNSNLTLYINHIKPLHKKRILEEIALFKGSWKVKILKDGEIINF